MEQVYRCWSFDFHASSPPVKNRGANGSWDLVRLCSRMSCCVWAVVAGSRWHHAFVSTNRKPPQLDSQNETCPACECSAEKGVQMRVQCAHPKSWRMFTKCKGEYPRISTPKRSAKTQITLIPPESNMAIQNHPFIYDSTTKTLIYRSDFPWP